MLGRHPVTDAAVGAGIGLVVASLEKGRPMGSRAAAGGALGVALGALLRRSRSGGRLLGSHYVGFAASSDGQGEEVFVGWSQPPRPVDVIASFNPRASRHDQARAVLLDYYHDDPLRYWSDNEAVKRGFGVKTKEDHDPLAFVAAYENQNDPVWQTHGTGMSWREMDKAVQAAIAHRQKLGPLPRSSYDTNPIVLYYYDNDKMKRITYPTIGVPVALNPNNTNWWAWEMGDKSPAGRAAGLDGVHTRETSDPKKIQVERENPGWTTKEQKLALKQKYPWLSDMNSGSAGDWTSEGFQWDRDIAGKGVIGSIVGAILALVSAVLDVTGFGAIVGVPLGISTPFIVAALNAVDTGLHAGDFGAAMSSLGPALVQAGIQSATTAASSFASTQTGGFKIPPAAIKTLGNTVSRIAANITRGQQKKLDFGQLWNEVAQQAGSYSKLGPEEAEAIAHMIGGGPAGHVFVQGYLGGQFLDAKSLAGIAKILQAYATFADPRIINIALMGMGIGYISKVQQQGGHATGRHVMGSFFYDADLAKSGLGNAVSPFVQMPYDKAVQAMHLRPEDRYGSRLDHPNWVDWSRWW